MKGNALGPEQCQSIRQSLDETMRRVERLVEQMDEIRVPEEEELEPKPVPKRRQEDWLALYGAVALLRVRLLDALAHWKDPQSDPWSTPRPLHTDEIVSLGRIAEERAGGDPDLGPPLLRFEALVWELTGLGRHLFLLEQAIPSPSREQVDQRAKSAPTGPLATEEEALLVRLHEIRRFLGFTFNVQKELVRLMSEPVLIDRALLDRWVQQKRGRLGGKSSGIPARPTPR